MDPELCRGMTEERCREDDLTAKRVGEEFRSRFSNQNKAPDENERERLLQRVSHTGTLNVLVLLTEFSDHEGRLERAPIEDFETLFNAPADETDDDLIETGSVRRYFELSSYGAITINAYINDWTVTDNTEEFYSQFGDRGRGTGTQNAMLTSLNQMQDEGFDFSTLDGDGNNSVDLTILFHSSYDGIIGEDDGFGTPSENRIASHARSSAQDLNWIANDGTIIGAYVVASAYRGLRNNGIARLGVLVHEMLHPFGLVDLYDRDVALTSNSGLGGLGNYDIMVRA